MTLTRSYAAITVALATVARETGLTPFDVRVLLAVGDAYSSTATTREITAVLAVDRSNVTRSLSALYSAGLVTGSGLDGGPRRPGVMTLVGLTRDGRKAVARVRGLVKAPKR